MGIKHWPSEERPREKLLARGPDALSDAELLAIILGRGTAGCDAVTLARRVLGECGGLGRLVAHERRRFAGFPGLGDAAFATLQAGLEIGRRALRDALVASAPITDAATAKRFLRAQLGARATEAFCAIFLDTRHRVIAFETLARGTIDSATVHPREVVKRVLELNAAAVILAHNHPSGVAEPSAADASLTSRLRDALKLIDVRVLDHLVIAAGEVASFADLGLLD